MKSPFKEWMIQSNYANVELWEIINTLYDFQRLEIGQGCTRNRKREMRLWWMRGFHEVRWSNLWLFKPFEYSLYMMTLILALTNCSFGANLRSVQLFLSTVPCSPTICYYVSAFGDYCPFTVNKWRRPYDWEYFWWFWQSQWGSFNSSRFWCQFNSTDNLGFG